MRYILLILFFFVSVLSGYIPVVNPDSLDYYLSQIQSDSSLEVRAELAYARGLYHTAKDHLERIESPSQINSLMLGQCCYVLAESYAAKAYFTGVKDGQHNGLAILGLAELYCGDLADTDSCLNYKPIVERFDYLKRFIELGSPEGAAFIENDSTFTKPVGWTIQFGAFTMRSLAETLATKIRGEGLKVWIVPRGEGDDVMFIVYGGSFTDKKEAAARADALSKEYVCRVVEMPE